MRAWILIVVAGCDSGAPVPKAPTSPPPPDPTVPAPVAVDAAVAADAPVDAAPAVPEVDVRPSVRAAPPWIGQKNIRQPKIGRDVQVTYELRREGDQALLIGVGGGNSDAYGGGVGELDLDGDGPPRVRPQEKKPPPAPREWRLSVVEKGKKLVFTPLDGSDTPLPIAECTRTTLAVVRADAELDVKNEDDCGSEPFWKPKTTKRITVLSCSDELAFAAAPGVEWYYMHGDCFQGGGWRALPKQ